MDRVYKADLPRFRKALLSLQKEFGRLNCRTDWVGLRIEPLLRHIGSLEQRVKSPRFSRERIRLRRGVSMFRSDLIYLRANILTLKKILGDEQRRQARRKAG